MLKRDKWRLIFIFAVVLVAAAIVFPINGRLQLGLDLKGGAHIVLQAKGLEGEALSDDSAERLVAVLRNRIDQYGIAEPVIQRQGKDRVAVDLPGVEDPAAALDLIGRTAVLEFRQVLGTTPSMPPEPQRKNYDSDPQFEEAKKRWAEAKKEVEGYAKEAEAKAALDPAVTVGRDDTGRAYLLGELYVTGKDLADARLAYDQFGKAAVSIKFNKEGSEQFAKATEMNVDKQIAIVLDGIVVSAPVVRERISGGEAQISGSFRTEEATRLAIMLRAGALPVRVEVLENRSVGPTLGADSVKSGLKSGLIGAGLVAIFMLVYYGVLGVAANIAMGVSLLLLMACMILLKTTLTLPGIGGIILTIGMAVDGNILIYERMREEYRSGKTTMAALDSGFRKALVVILDSNITTLIAAGVLFYFGAGPVRGFAVTLSLGVITAMFGNLVVTRALLHIMLNQRKNIAL